MHPDGHSDAPPRPPTLPTPTPPAPPNQNVHCSPSQSAHRRATAVAPPPSAVMLCWAKMGCFVRTIPCGPPSQLHRQRRRKHSQQQLDARTQRHHICCRRVLREFEPALHPPTPRSTLSGHLRIPLTPPVINYARIVHLFHLFHFGVLQFSSSDGFNLRKSQNDHTMIKGYGSH